EVVGQTKELTQLLEVLRRRPITNHSYLPWVHPDTSGRHNVAQVLHLRLCPEAFGTLSKQLLPPQHLKHKLKMLQVLLARLGVDQDVIQVANDEPVDIRPKHAVHDRLERRRGIGQPERQDRVLEVTKGGPKSSLRHVGSSNANLIVPLLQVNRAEIS
ncbi:hypothetical protein Vretimale_9805, partial [Volvox reticuliferus]